MSMKLAKSVGMIGMVGVIASGMIVGSEASALAQELIVNGSFEEPHLASETWRTFNSIPGWRLARGADIEIQDYVAGSPHIGSQHVELDSHSSTSIFQDIPTRPGQAYTLSLAFSPRPGTPANDNILKIHWDGRYLDTVMMSGEGLSDTRWTTKSYIVTATGQTTRLELRDAGISNGLGTYVDAVSLRLR
ncbi:DUF642 domain-containing protein [Polyangium jinanense]|uniref:DUF642 domain-containing protein n=1 Tax=Polyangium jinanense TaxID=2829994 RepID=A0A9X4AQR8_9BACT|nr:DUF642 domain-containing protein [Polyangium jinanense]MDC3953567.1 DUF642 domain-containing protein [Polyangium jinanense]MDC3979312.1 DUF642 domain-containing protein [Polyangium jinanense]